MNYIVYQAYGNRDILNETIYSILSILKFHQKDPDIRFIIYTDNKNYFMQYLGEDIRFEYESLNNEMLKEWKGEIGFVHRVKICMLLDFYKKHKSPFLYLDSDTYITSSLAETFSDLKKGSLFMHTNEGVIDTSKNILIRKIRKFIRKNVFILPNGDKISIPLTYCMWNAGALGICGDIETLINKTLVLTDVIYKMYQKHIMEQLAFSFTIQERKEPRPLDSIIFHYWNFKEFRGVLNNFFKVHERKKPDQLIGLIHQVDPRMLIKPKMEFQALPSIIRKIRKLFGATWQMPEYDLLKV
jgi:hypothetical protein